MRAGFEHSRDRGAPDRSGTTIGTFSGGWVGFHVQLRDATSDTDFPVT